MFAPAATRQPPGLGRARRLVIAMRQYTPLFGLLAALGACQATDLDPAADEAAAPHGSVNPPQRTVVGAADLGATVTRTIAVPYHPGASADNTTITGDGADQFAVEDVQCVEGGSCVYTVAFSPDAAGTSTALLSLGTGAGTIPFSKLTGLGKPASLLATQYLMVQKGTAPGANGRGVVYEVPNPTLYCDADCDAAMQGYEGGTVVTLRAEPEAGNEFLGWSGACTGTADECTLTMSGPRAVVASFRGTNQLQVQPLSAAGVIKSSDGELTCGTDCSHRYDAGTQVTLSYQLPAGVVFSNWEGICSGAGTGPCTVTLDQDTQVFAQFRNVVTVTRPAPLGGSVTVASRVAGSADGQINCAADCQGEYATGTRVELVASVPTTTQFDGWEGCPEPQGSSCFVTVTGPITVRPKFRAIDSQIVEVASGEGSIEVRIGGATYTCPGGACVYPAPREAQVTLRATPVAGKAFVKWDAVSNNTCAGDTDTECTYTVSRAHHNRVLLEHAYRLRVTTGHRTPSWRVGTGAWTRCTTALCIIDLTFPGVVQLSAGPSPDNANCERFTGWSGACTGTGICSVQLDAPKTVRANWSPIFDCDPM
jgi:hypothetical protein